MEPITAAALITAIIPFITAGLKRLFTKRLPDRIRPGINAVIPLVLGMVSAGLYTYQQTGDIWAGLATGLGSGGVASSARDIDKNLTRIIETAYTIARKTKAKP